MAKNKIMFECQACGYESPKWLGRCPNCGSWNQMEEQLAPAASASHSIQVTTHRTSQAGKAYRLDEIPSQTEKRISTQFDEFDRVLGGGVVPGSLVLLGGDPGIGKSTLLLQVSIELANQKQTVLYVSGEESLTQIKLRAERLALSGTDFYLLAETNLQTIASEISSIQPDIVIIDSIQTMSVPENQGVVGSVSQLREATGVLMRIAKDNQIARC